MRPIRLPILVPRTLVLSVAGVLMLLLPRVGESQSPTAKPAAPHDARTKSPPDAAASKDAQSKDAAGKADVLRMLPKKFARFVSGDPVKSQVTLHIEGEAEPKSWPLTPDAELKRVGWWARLEQFRPGERVWAWFDINREKQPTAILMLADEISQQDIHGQPPTLEAADLSAGAITFKPAKGDKRTLKLAPGITARKIGDEFEFTRDAASPRIATTVLRAERGDRLYVQTINGTASLILDEDGLTAAGRQQDVWLRERWRREGLAGTVSFLHRLGGEMDVILDHEAIRWGRYLKHGDTVTLGDAVARDENGAPKMFASGIVKQVTPWRERTSVRLVVGGLDQSLLAIGQRVQAKLPEPPTAVQDSPLPTDIGRPRGKAERIDWFLSSVYCTCTIGGDGCTGMFYTLASCSAHNCGLPRKMRGDVDKLIDKGLTDEQIYAQLRKTHGPLLSQPHLLP